MRLTRRGFLRFAAATVAAQRGAIAAQEKDALIVRSDRPADLETPVALLDRSWITPTNLHYVRSHLATPQVDPTTWTLTVDGAVERPLRLDLESLRRFVRVERVVTLECAGNGRAFYRPPVPGIQWERGAAGTARWAGARLADLLHRAHVKPAGRHLVMNGADTPMGAVPDFVRSIPLEKALDPDTLIAYEMNGEPLPIHHGFPARVLVPGWQAAASVKWITHLTVAEEEADGHFMRNAYRIPRRPVAPLTAVPADDMVVFTELGVKAIFTAPLDRTPVKAGRLVELRGFAWAGEAEIVRVDLSTDGGRTWRPAVLGPERARYAWVRWRLRWRPTEPGTRRVLCRATDSRGRTQPIEPFWNPSGYGWNAVDRLELDVQA